jgi:hypothetical protein
MRLLLYLVALFAGLSPAEARSAAFAAPVSVGAHVSVNRGDGAQNSVHRQAQAARAPRLKLGQASIAVTHFAITTSTLPDLTIRQTDRLRE